MRVGLDIGGTKIDMCVLDEKNEIVRVKTFQRAHTYVGLLDQLKIAIDELPPDSLLHGIGLGVPGLVNAEGRVIAVNNIAYLQKNDIARDLAQFVNGQVTIANHLQCFALSEATSGFVLDRGFAVCLIIGTGVGAGLLFDGKLYLGANRMAGEFGAAKVVGNTSHNTFEEIISGAALQRRSCVAFVDTDDKLSATSNDKRYSVARDAHYMGDLADFVVNIIYWLDPAQILLAGGIGMADGLAESLNTTIAKRMPRGTFHTKLRRAFFGVLSGVRGAALLTTNLENANHLRRAGAAVFVVPN